VIETQYNMKKKVLVVAPTYWPEGSGGTLATHLIVEHLSQAGRFDLTVLTGTRNPEIVPGVSYIVDPFVKLVEKRFSIPRLVENRYGKLIEKHDVVYAVYAYTFIPVAKKFGKRVVVHLHDYRPISPSSVVLASQSENLTLSRLAIESFRVKYLERRDIKSLLLNVGEATRTPLIAKWVSEADVVIAVSRRHAELLARALPPLRNKLVVVYNPPPPIPRIKREPAETPVFLYVGGESYLKGFYVLIEAIEMALREGVRAKFIFAGKYSSRARHVMSRINKVYGNVIHLTGRILHTELLNLYKQAWALLFPSISEEPLPYAVMEAVLTQTIPISSKVGGVPEIMVSSKLREFMFEPGSSKVLYGRIAELSSLGNAFRQYMYDLTLHFETNVQYLFYNFKSTREVLEKVFIDYS
jgi:glycosyltransferase involved in cell wall biosynthesis